MITGIFEFLMIFLVSSPKQHLPKDMQKSVYVPVISKTLEHIETFNINYKDSS